jgi:hypothetical protein
VQNIFSSSLLSKNINVNRNIILPVVLCECKTWSPTLREECRLRVFGNRVPRRDKFTGEWRKLHNEERNDLHVYSSPNIIRVFKSRRM